MSTRWPPPTVPVDDRAAAPDGDDRVRQPSRGDQVARLASEVIGGPVGRYASPLGRSWRFYAAVLAAASAVTSALSVVLRAPCVADGWSTPDQFWHACFSDVPATYRDSGLVAGLQAYLSGRAGAPAQPPLTSLVMALLAALVPSGEVVDQMRVYFAIWTVAGAVLLALTTWWTAGTVRRFPLRAAVVALSPVALLVLPVSPDVLGVALTAAALYAWTRDKVALTGVLLGLAVAARSYPVVVVLALLLVSLRAGRFQPGVRVAGFAAATAGGVMTLLAVLNSAAASAAYASWWDSGAGFGSPWLLPQLAGRPLLPVAVTVLAAAGWLAALVAGALFALALPRRPGVAEVSLVMLAVVLLTGKSLTVQSALWLVPLVALVGLPWKDVLLWSTTEALHFVAVWLYLAGVSVPNRGLPASWYSAFLVVRLGGVLWLLARTWQLARSRPPVYDAEGAVVDSAWGEAESDEVAGPLRGAPDALVVRFG